MRSSLILLVLVALVYANSSQEHKKARSAINHGHSKNLRQRLNEQSREVAATIHAKGPSGVNSKIPYASNYSDDKGSPGRSDEEPRAPAPYAADFYDGKGIPGSASADAKGPSGASAYYGEKSDADSKGSGNAGEGDNAPYVDINFGDETDLLNKDTVAPQHWDAKGPSAASSYNEKDVSGVDSTWVEASYPGKGVGASYGEKSDDWKWVSDERKDDTLESKAKVARDLVHKSRWMVLGTRASHPDFMKYTGTNVQLVTDVIKGRSTGIPYTYMSQKDFSVNDLFGDDHASILFSQATIDDSCKKLPLEAKDPACPRTMLIGEMNRVDNSTQEYKDAYKSLMDKFPALKNVDQKEYDVGKMVIRAVFVRASDGGIEQLPMDLYEGASARGRRSGR